MKALSLFSGIGGLDLAAEAAGIHTAAFCEIEPFCRGILSRHWPGVPLFEDIFKLRGDEIGTVDVIHGGFPCQPFSLAGRQRGQEDERYLWPEFSRLVGELRPLWVVAENVPGIFKNDVAGVVCADLERQGYSVGIWNYEAACVGAPHRRSRVFFVGHAMRLGLPGQLGGPLRQKPADRREDVPDGDGVRKLQPQRTFGELGGRAGDIRKNVPDHDSQQREKQRVPLAGKAQFGSAGCDSWWESESDVGRVAHGVPGRVDRLRALGNAVVPAQAYPIFKAIKTINDMEEKYNA